MSQLLSTASLSDSVSLYGKNKDIQQSRDTGVLEMAHGAALDPAEITLFNSYKSRGQAIDTSYIVIRRVES